MSAVRSYLSVAVLVLCLAAIVPLQSWIDQTDSATVDDEILYLSDGEDIKTMSLGYDSLLADVYWMRAIQYFGGKIRDDRNLLNTRDVNHLLLLYPLIDTTTTLDPHLMPAYVFGGYFVHDYIDANKGIAILEKGIRNNPDNFRLYQQLAYIYWRAGDCEKASKVYADGGAAPGSPFWMKEMSALVLAKCGRPDVTLELLHMQYEATDDPRIREDLTRQIQSYQALIEVTYLKNAVSAYQQQFGAYPPSLSALLRALSRDPNLPDLRLGAGGNPLDPKGVPYVYDPATGAVTTDPNSVQVPIDVPTAAPTAPAVKQ